MEPRDRRPRKHDQKRLTRRADRVVEPTVEEASSLEAAIGIEIVFYECAMIERTFNEPSVTEQNPSKRTLLERALREKAHIEVSPIPLSTLKCTAKKCSVDARSIIGGKAGECAVAENGV